MSDYDLVYCLSATSDDNLAFSLSREHAAEDDARDLKIAQDAVDGNLRNGRRKRQRGLGELDDSDSDEDDDSKRPKIEKKRRIDGDKLEELGEHCAIHLLCPLDVHVSHCRETSGDCCFLQGVPSRCRR